MTFALSLPIVLSFLVPGVLVLEALASVSGPIDQSFHPGTSDTRSQHLGHCLPVGTVVWRRTTLVRDEVPRIDLLMS
jgi:hypothetical protein